MLTSAKLHIDLAALAENYRTLLTVLRGKPCAAVVKADAYGLGALAVSPVLYHEGCRHFFVATLEEAVNLRSVLTDDDSGIYVLLGPWQGEAKTYLKHRLIPVLNSPAQLELWQAAAAKRGRTLDAVLHIDTGMNRLGFVESEMKRLVQDPSALEGIHLRFVMSHLANADDNESPFNHEQLKRFEHWKPYFTGCRFTFANSAGIFIGPEFHQDMGRTGAAIYGVNPTPKEANPMKNVVSVFAPILRTHVAGGKESVGYSNGYIAEPGTRIATAMCGYADGYIRSLSNSGVVYIENIAVPVIGRVSMDLITLDVSQVPEHLLVPGTPVELVGPNSPIDQTAKKANTIAYEILTRLGARLQRSYRDSIPHPLRQRTA